MIQADSVQHHNDLLRHLGDLLGTHGARKVQRTYISALNSLCSPAAASGRFAALAEMLREAADVADGVSRVTAKN